MRNLSYLSQINKKLNIAINVLFKKKPIDSDSAFNNGNVNERPMEQKSEKEDSISEVPFTQTTNGKKPISIPVTRIVNIIEFTNHY